MSVISRLKIFLNRGEPGDQEEINKLSVQVEAPKKPKISSALSAALSLGVAAIAAKVAGFGAPAAAGTINTTAIIDMVTSMTSIFPAMGDMVVAIVPTLLILAIVAFLLGFFDSILDAIQGAMKFGR